MDSSKNPEHILARYVFSDKTKKNTVRSVIKFCSVLACCMTWFSLADVHYFAIFYEKHRAEQLIAVLKKVSV